MADMDADAIGVSVTHCPECGGTGIDADMTADTGCNYRCQRCSGTGHLVTVTAIVEGSEAP
jgi:DnaJ-class molecular chaperone